MNNLLQTILRSLGFTTIDEKTALEALTLAKFREDHRLTTADLLELAKTSTHPEWIKKFTNKLISYAEASGPESHFTSLCTAFLWVNLAQLHESTLQIILRQAFCLDVFLKDAHNFPTYLITLAEKYTFQIYAFLWMARSPSGHDKHGKAYYTPEESTIVEKHKKLLTVFLNHPGNRSFRSQLVALLDHVDLNLFRQEGYNPYGFMEHIIADFNDLIRGEDGKENLRIIVQSKQRAEYLLGTILLKVEWQNPSLLFAKIPLESIIQIGQQHPELSYRIVDAIVENVVRKEKGTLDAYTPALETLLPLLKVQADKEHAPSQLSLATLLFTTHLSTQEQNLDSAVVLCQTVYELNNTTEGMYYQKKAIALLVEFANAYYTGCLDRLRLPQTKKDILMAGALLEYAVAKIDHRTAKTILSDPVFSLAYGKKLEEFKLDRAYFVYQRAELPSQAPDLYHDLPQSYKDKSWATYLQAILTYPFVKQQQLLALGNILQDIKNNPQSSLQIAIQCAQRGQTQIAAHILLIINAQRLPTHRLEDFGECCVKTAMRLITTHQQHHPLACALLTHIPAEAPASYHSAQNLLMFANRSVNNHDDSNPQQLARTEVIQVLINHYEMLYAIILNSLAIITNDPLKQLERDTLLLLRQLQQELLSLHNPSRNLSLFKQHEDYKKLPSDMQQEISAPPPLRDHHLPREMSESQKRINTLRRFNLAHEPTKPPAQRWAQNNLGFWHKATVVDRDTNNNNNNNNDNNVFCQKKCVRDKARWAVKPNAC